MTIQPHALGRERRFYAQEISFDSNLAPFAGTDAIKALAMSMEFGQERAPRADSRPTRSLLERITRVKTVSWSAESYILPSGSLGVAPDVGVLLKALLGTETITGSVDVVYSLLNTQLLTALQLCREASGVVMESLEGAWVEQGTISVTGGEEPKISLEGGAREHIQTGNSTLDGALSGAETSFDVQTGEGQNFENLSRVQVGTSVGSGNGHEVSDVTGDTITVSPAIVGAQVNGAAVIPFAPTEVTAGSPIAGILGALDIDTPVAATALPITSVEVVIKNNIKPVNDEAFQDSVTQLIPIWREVTGSLGVRAGRDEVVQLGARKSFAPRQVDIQIGTVAGSILKIALPQVEIDFSPLEIPEAEEGTFNLPFTALGSSGEDEVTLTFE